MAIVVTHSAISRGVGFIVLWCKPWVLGHYRQTQECLKINSGYGNCISNDSCLQYLFSIFHIFHSLNVVTSSVFFLGIIVTLLKMYTVIILYCYGILIFNNCP